jgi:hypothetical protein
VNPNKAKCYSNNKKPIYLLVDVYCKETAQLLLHHLEFHQSDGMLFSLLLLKFFRISTVLPLGLQILKYLLSGPCRKSLPKSDPEK